MNQFHDVQIPDIEFTGEASTLLFPGVAGVTGVLGIRVSSNSVDL